MGQTPRATAATRKTQGAVRAFNRRWLLTGAAASAGLLLLPFGARAAANQVNVLCWASYIPDRFLKDFKKATGITANMTIMGSNEEMITQLTATHGRAWDIIAPSVHRKSQLQALNMTRPWDLKKIPNLKNIQEKYLKMSEGWSWGGGQHHLPHVWGTEAISWRTDKFQTEYGKLSFGDLWLPEMKGWIQGRPHSLMAGIGRLLAAKGEMPPFEDSYKDEGAMRKAWGRITAAAIERKAWIRAFWHDHGTQKTNFTRNGVVMGQTWGAPAIELAKAGQPIRYMAPKEGAFAWMDGLSLTRAAKNPEPAHAFVNALYTVKAAAQMGNETAYNSVVAGVREKLDNPTKAAFDAAYPGDALEKLWWWPDEPVWYAHLRGEFRDRFLSA